MNASKATRLGNAITAALVFLVVILCLIPLNLRAFGKSLHTIFDAGHFPLFGLFAFGITIALAVNEEQKAQRKKRHFLRGVLLTMFFAAVIEIVQPIFGRSCELDDFIVGSVGAIVGSRFAVLTFAPARRTDYAVTACVAGAVLAFCLRSLPFAYAADRYLMSHFPMLGDFEDAREIDSWMPQFKHYEPIAAQPFRGNATSGAFSLAIEAPPLGMNAEEYAAGMQDWSAFRTLQFSVVNPGEPLEMLVLLTDRPRFLEAKEDPSKNILVPSGKSVQSIDIRALVAGSQHREFHLDRVRTLVLGFRNPSKTAAATIFIDAVALRE